MTFSRNDYKLEVSSREGRKQEEGGATDMKLNDIVEMWNEISEDMIQAHQL